MRMQTLSLDCVPDIQAKEMWSKKLFLSRPLIIKLPEVQTILLMENITYPVNAYGKGLDANIVLAPQIVLCQYIHISHL